MSFDVLGAHGYGGKGLEINEAVDSLGVAQTTISKNDFVNVKRYGYKVQTLSRIEVDPGQNSYLNEFDMLHIKDNLFVLVGGDYTTSDGYAILLDITENTVTRIGTYLMPLSGVYGEGTLTPDKSKLVISGRDLDGYPYVLIADIDIVNETLNFGSMSVIEPLTITSSWTVKMLDNTYGLISWHYSDHSYTTLFSIDGKVITTLDKIITDSNQSSSGIVLNIVDSTTAISMTREYNGDATLYTLIRRDGEVLLTSSQYSYTWSNTAYPLDNETDIRTIEETDTHYYVKIMMQGGDSNVTWTFRVPKSISDLTLYRQGITDNYDTVSDLRGDIGFLLNSNESYRTYIENDSNDRSAYSQLWNNKYVNSTGVIISTGYGTLRTYESSGLRYDISSCVVPYGSKVRIVLVAKSDYSVNPMAIMIHDFEHQVSKFEPTTSEDVFPAIALNNASSGENVKLLTIV